MKYHRRVRHSHAYYARVNMILIGCLSAGTSQAQMVDTLAADGLPSPTGVAWTIGAIKQVLLRVRRRYGPNYVALLESVFDGYLTREQARPLLQTL